MMDSAALSAQVRSYGGGGYILRLTGYIGDLRERIELLKRKNWVNNGTRDAEKKCWGRQIEKVPWQALMNRFYYLQFLFSNYLHFVFAQCGRRT